MVGGSLRVNLKNERVTACAREGARGETKVGVREGGRESEL